MHLIHDLLDELQRLSIVVILHQFRLFLDFSINLLDILLEEIEDIFNGLFLAVSWRLISFRKVLEWIFGDELRGISFQWRFYFYLSWGMTSCIESNSFFLCLTLLLIKNRQQKIQQLIDLGIFTTLLLLLMFLYFLVVFWYLDIIVGQSGYGLFPSDVSREALGWLMIFLFFNLQRFLRLSALVDYIIIL